MLSRRNAIIATILAALFMFLFAQAVHADTFIAKQGDDQAVFFDKPCTDQLVLNRLEPEAAKEYRAAVARFQGQMFNACWRMMGNSYYLVYEDGDQGIVPAHEARLVKDA
jgi:hypothetical protein